LALLSLSEAQDLRRERWRAKLREWDKKFAQIREIRGKEDQR